MTCERWNVSGMNPHASWHSFMVVHGETEGSSTVPEIPNGGTVSAATHNVS